MSNRKVDGNLLANMLKQNLSIKQIASVFNTSKGVIYQNIKKYDLKAYASMQKSYKRLTDKQIEEIRTLSASGMLKSAIAEKFNVNYSTISRLLNKVTYTKKRDYKAQNTLAEEKINKILALRKEGKLIRQIAKETGHSSATIIKYIHQYENRTNKKED